MNSSLPPEATTQLIAVIGATGKQGGAVVDALLDQGERVRALVRDPVSAAARALQDRDVELVTGDLAAPASLDPLLHGVDGVFAMSTPVDGADVEVTSGIAIAEAAARAEVAHVVFSSVGGADRSTGIAHFESK